MKKIIFKTVLLLLVVAFSLSGCRTSSESYVCADGSGFVYEGVKYVSFVEYIPSHRMQVHLWSVETIELPSEYWWLFLTENKIERFDCDIPLMRSYYCIDDGWYHVPEDQYKECAMYMENLTWSDQLTGNFSQSLEQYLTSNYTWDPVEGGVRSETHWLKDMPIYQYDSTQTFSREIGVLVVRAQGDCYFFPNHYAYSVADQPFTPEGEEYDQLTEQYKEYQIPAEYWEEIIEILP